MAGNQKIQVNGVTVQPPRPALNFMPLSGTAIAQTDDTVNGATIITLPGQPSAATVPFSATPTFNVATAAVQRIVLTGNITGYTVPAGAYEGQSLTLKFIQDGTGSRTLAGTPANVRLAGGALTLTTTASKVDTLNFLWDATLTQWIEECRALGA